MPMAVDRSTQGIGNLVDNAVRYTPQGGRIALTVSWLAEAGHELRALITATDTGSGIAPAELPHVFGRFFRGDKPRARASVGSGLSLAIVKQLGAAQHGKLRAERSVFTRPMAATSEPGLPRCF